MCSALPIEPIVARHSLETRRTSPEGSVICAHLPSRALIVTEQPALRPICPPWPGCISTLWTDMPGGTLRSGMQLPTRGSTSSLPDMSLSPAFSPSGARM